MAESIETPGAQNSPRKSTGNTAGCFVLLFVALYLVTSPLVQYSKWRASADSNPAVAEAVAWHNGTLELPRRFHDTALHDGHIYNVFPPLFTLLSYAALALGDWLQTPPDQFYAPWYVIIVALPLPLLGFWAFRSATNSAPWAAAFTFLWITGTPILPGLVAAQGGGISHINHLLSQTGLMLLLAALFEGKRHWPAWIGLIIAAWTRPLTILFALPIAWFALDAPPAVRKKRLAGLAAAVIIALALPMALSWARFGSPFESGYRFLYEGRDDNLARAGREALFSPRYIPRNAWYMNLEVPQWEFGTYGLRPDPDPNGASIWMTMPILLFLIVDARRWWRHPPLRALLLSTLPIVLGVLMFHGTGYIQPGYYRFALDFIPAWLLVIATFATDGHLRRRLVIAAMAWSALYFNLVTGMYAT